MGFSDVLIRLMRTIDTELIQPREAEEELLEKLKVVQKKPLRMKEIPDKRTKQIENLMRRSDSVVLAEIEKVDEFLVEKGIIS